MKKLLKRMFLAQVLWGACLGQASGYLPDEYERPRTVVLPGSSGPYENPQFASPAGPTGPSGFYEDSRFAGGPSGPYGDPRRFGATGPSGFYEDSRFAGGPSGPYGDSRRFGATGPSGPYENPQFASPAGPTGFFGRNEVNPYYTGMRHPSYQPDTLSKEEKREGVICNLNRRQFNKEFLQDEGIEIKSSFLQQKQESNFAEELRGGESKKVERIYVDDKSVVDFFSKDEAYSFPNLKEVRFLNYGDKPEDLDHVEGFLKKFFDPDREDLYPSLFKIDLGKVSEIKFGIIDQIHNHFLNYDYFVRDMPQDSARYDVTAAFLNIEVGLKNFRGDMYDKWRIERMSDDHYPILYRIDLSTHIHGPLITNVHS